MEESILTSIKTLLGIQPDDLSFDTEIAMHINSVIFVLTELGVGVETGYKISGPTETWAEYLGAYPDLEAVKTYIYLRVRLVFDSPQNSFLVAAIEKQIDEYGWRLYAHEDAK